MGTSPSICILYIYIYIYVFLLGIRLRNKCNGCTVLGHLVGCHSSGEFAFDFFCSNKPLSSFLYSIFNVFLSGIKIRNNMRWLLFHAQTENCSFIGTLLLDGIWLLTLNCVKEIFAWNSGTSWHMACAAQLCEKNVSFDFC